MERRNNGTSRIKLPELKRMDTRKYTRKETTRPINSQGHNTGIKNTQGTRMQSQLGKKIKTRNRHTVERNRQKHSTRDRNKKRHEHLVQKHTTQSHVPKRNNHNHQNNTMHLMWKKP